MNTTSKVILATLVIFGAGIITGTLAMRHSADGAQHSPRSASVESSPPAAGSGTVPARKEDLLARLDRELNLKAEQRERIEKIIGEGQDRIKCLCQEELTKTRAKIRAELTEEQQIVFAECFKKKPASAREATNSLPEPK